MLNGIRICLFDCKPGMGGGDASPDGLGACLPVLQRPFLRSNKGACWSKLHVIKVKLIVSFSD